MSRSPNSRTSPAPAHSADPPPTVSPRWLLSAILLVMVGALVCGYITLCLLFYQGQWQILFHPSRSITATPASVGLPFDDIRFDVTDAGIPRLDGWWLPAAPNAPYANDTILYLHGASGSLSDSVPALAALHAIGLNVFAIDYQGFGRSAGRHPTERLAGDDALAAFAYLTDIRHISPARIVVYGAGAGSTLAARVAARLAPAAAILQDPGVPARRLFLADPRVRILPLSLLQNEFLDPSASLASTHVPLLFLDVHPADPARAHQLFLQANDPKQYDDLRSSPPPVRQAALRRFLDGILR